MQPFKGFKLALVNFFSFLFSFICTRPRRFILDLLSKKSWNVISEQLFNPNQPDELKAFSAAFGVFMGIIPIWGFQTLAAIFLAVALRLNKSLVVIFSLVSFPPLMPVIIFLSYRIGRFWTGNNVSHQNIGKRLEQYIYGSITLAIVAAIAIGLLTFVSLKLVKMLKQYRLTASLKKA